MRCNAAASVLAAAICLMSCAPAQIANHQSIPQDEPIRKPRRHDVNQWQASRRHQVFRQVGRPFNPATYIQDEAENINAWDEVQDSAWFTNRLGKEIPPVAEFARGARSGEGPDLNGPWIVVASKKDGIQLGFRIKDSRGVEYVIKLDPPNNPELASGAEIIGSLILHAAGYFVPDDRILFVPPSIFHLEETSTIMPPDQLTALLAPLPRNESGMIRILASKVLPGQSLGPFFYEGRRRDDPNDRINHENRRELRGLRVLSAWINNADTRPANTYDTFIGDDELGFVRHYLIDFGSTLGSFGRGPKSPPAGYTYKPIYLMGRNRFSLALFRPYWRTNQLSPFSSVGLFESTNFDPIRWRPSYPNPAFQKLTDRDGFWASRIIMRFSDAALRAIVAEAQYSDPAAAEYLAKTLAERRQKIGLHWFRRLSPLVEFKLESSGNAAELRFLDLGRYYGFDASQSRRYTYTLSLKGDTSGDAKNISVGAENIDTGGSVKIPFALAQRENEAIDFNILVKVFEDQEPVGKGVVIYGYCAQSRACSLTGLQRQ